MAVGRRGLLVDCYLLDAVRDPVVQERELAAHRQLPLVRHPHQLLAQLALVVELLSQLTLVVQSQG